MSHLFNAPSKLDHSSAKARHIEDVNNFLDQMEDRRMNAERIQDRFASAGAATFHPGYDAEEVDDGRLDPICSTGFIPVGELPDETVDESDLTDELDEEPVWRPQAPATAATERPSTEASRQKYAKIHRDRFVSTVKFIGVLKRGVGIVPYTTGMLR